MRADDIIYKSDNRSKNRAKIQNLVAKLYKVEDNKIIYTVTSSKGNKQYLVKIQLLSLTNNKLKSLKGALSSDLKISCTCPGFLYQGYKYISYKASTGIEPENRAPDITNPERHGMACKHILVALEQLKSDYSKIYDLFKVQARNQPNKEKTPTDIKTNKNSNDFTELDLEIVENFKSECTKLYDEYTNYLKSNNSEVDFLDSESYSKLNPSVKLSNLSKPAKKLISSTMLGKLKTVDDIISMIDRKKNGFNILLDSDTKFIVKKINSYIGMVAESCINNIILNLIEERYGIYK